MSLPRQQSRVMAVALIMIAWEALVFPGAVLAQSAWQLVWSDEFNAPANTPVDTGRNGWLYDLGTGYGCSGCPSNWGTGEVETMTASTDNVSHDGVGHLRITPIRDASGRWTSGRIESQRCDFQAPAGGMLAVEALLQQPNVSGDAALGYWPAFWSLGSRFRGNYLNWPGVGEIDVAEGVNGRSSVFGTLHCGTYPGGKCNEPTGIGSGEHACPTCPTTFHTYRMELDKSVTPNQIRWYLDGVNYFTVRSDQGQLDPTTWANATDHGFFILLDVAMGGGFPAAFGGGPTPATASGIPMLIDYVRVYTLTPAALFYAVPPCRVADTRTTDAPALAANSSREFDVVGRCGIPADAHSVAIIVTSVMQTDQGDLRLYPAGTCPPLASAINFVPAHTKANNAIIPLGQGGRIAVQCDMPPGSNGQTHFLFDVYGYFR